MPKKKVVNITSCPVCQKRRNDNEFEKHHVFPKAKGGLDHPKNMLPICLTCHAIITRGCIEDLRPRYMACMYHQLREHGLSFLLASGLTTSNDPFWGKKFAETVPPSATASEVDELLRTIGRIEYERCVEEIKGEIYFIELPQMAKWASPERLMAVLRV